MCSPSMDNEGWTYFLSLISEDFSGVSHSTSPDREILIPICRDTGSRNRSTPLDNANLHSRQHLMLLASLSATLLNRQYR